MGRPFSNGRPIIAADDIAALNGTNLAVRTDHSLIRLAISPGSARPGGSQHQVR